jgi:quinohemoprotein ethanol dehydrogenase
MRYLNFFRRLSLKLRSHKVVIFCLAILQAQIAWGGINARNMVDQSWPSFGGQADEQRYSPLTQINDHTVENLQLAWFHDLPQAHSVSAPVAAEGKVFTATGHTLVSAFDAVSGELLWRYDSEAAIRAGSLKLRNGWGIRGLSYSKGYIFVGTHDGRLLSLDAKTGSLVWSVVTTEEGDNRYITGAPRSFSGKVVIGHAGADGAGARGYVTCYEAGSGRKLWRFYTVPGDPAKGYEDETMRMAAETWHGRWWRHGGGGTVWNAMTYDPEYNRFYLGVGNGYPYNRQLRSDGKGDNLFLASIVAVDADTGRYVWHYQTTPGEEWDYAASMDMTLANLTIDGKNRKVLMQAPKNGFFYVIDRNNGSLISAEPFAKVTWASAVDPETGRPIENPGARYHGKELFEAWPGGRGAHSWLPQSFSPITGLVYLPVLEAAMLIGDKGLDLKAYQGPINTQGGAGVTGDFDPDLPGAHRSFLKAWDPLEQRARWTVELPGSLPGGTMATAGNLVFQGRIDRKFNAYAADTGKLLWSFNTHSPVMAPPITFSVKGRQYVTVITGSGNQAGFFSKIIAKYDVEYRSMPRRVLTFALDGKAVLPPPPAKPRFVRPADPEYHGHGVLARRGNQIYHSTGCALCHGINVVGGGAAPDLRLSPVILDDELFRSVVEGGALVARGMPRFDELSDEDLKSLRQYLRAKAQELPDSSKAGH